MKLTLYHGTSLSKLESIKKNGLIPRGKNKSNWESGIGKSRPDLVYLTDCYACYFASMATKKKGDKPVVLKIEIETDEIGVYPDEEYLFEVLFERGKGLKPDEAKELYESIDPTEFYSDEYWQSSLKYMGNITVDAVKKDSILGYAVGDGFEFLMNCDPSISPLNYAILGNRYRAYLESLTYKELTN